MMNKGERKRFRNYFNRFLDPKVPFRQKWVSFWRYIGMFLALIVEKIRGTDYVMINHEMNSVEHCGNYTMSPRKVLKRIFNDIDNKNEKGFIDIGCGKGYAIKCAFNEGFKISGGIEYNTKLYDICISNLRKDNVDIKFTSCGMAQNYEHYDLFDVFYFNNPFDAEILIDVTKKIFETHKNKKCRCYYLNPNNEAKTNAFLSAGFKFVKQIKDPSESYFHINVFEN